MSTESFYQNSWLKFEYDAALKQWIDHALPFAREQINAKENAKWLRCGGTWFVGVNALPNDPHGVVGDSDQLGGPAVDFLKALLSENQLLLDKGQISVCYPGYPQPSLTETKTAHLYRNKRDSAHVDGLRIEGTGKRYLLEHHSFILGIPLVEASADASPLVVWEGSHEIMRSAFVKLFKDIPFASWSEIDVTDVYRRARRKVFDTCKRIEVFAGLGEAFVVHRLAVHGIAPWGEAARAGVDGRVICYFRPEFKQVKDWLFER